MRRHVLHAYIGLTCLAAAGVVLGGLLLPTAHLDWSWWGAVCLLGAAIAGEAAAVPILSPLRRRDRPYVVSIATIPHIASALLLPPPVAATLAGLGMLVDELRGRRSPDRVVFNTACTTAAVGLAAAAANLLHLQGAELGDGGGPEVLGFLLVASLYFVAYTLLVAGVGAVADGQAFWTVLVSNARCSAPAELAVAVLGGLGAFIWVKNPFWLPIGACPALIAQLTFRSIAASSRKTTQLLALDRLGRALSASVTPDEIFRAGSAELRGDRAVEGAFLVLWDPPLDAADGVAAGPDRAQARRDLAERVRAEGAAVLIDDTAQAPSLGRAAPLGQSWLALPLGDRQAIGCLGLVASQPRAFGADDLDFFRLVAERIGLAIDSGRRASALLAVESEQRALRRSEERFRSLIGNAADVIVILDPDGTVRYQSPSVQRAWGYAPDALTGQPLADFVHASDLAAARELVARALAEPATSPSGELRVRHGDGSWRHVEVIITNLLADEGVKGLVATFHDVTERRAFENKLEHQAYHDPLTGLPNRARFIERLHQALLRTQAPGALGVLFLDLDNFKVINDSLGHAAGDRLLVIVARRLAACVRPADTVARLGGDEFTVLLEALSAPGEAAEVAERIVAALRAPVDLNGREVFVSASVGVALNGDGAARPEDLLRNADLALYRAKANGKSGTATFDRGLEERAMERLELETNLRRALERGELSVHYQPIVSLADGRVAEVEALVRWEVPGRGAIPPAAFIPVAEETGLIVPLGEWVLGQACRQVAEWQTQFPSDPPLVLSVNLSTRQFQQARLADALQRIVGEAGLDPATLKLELTESAIMQDPAATAAKLAGLKRLGIQLAVDDFGTGYSSLNYLKSFSVDTLKIDRSFVDGLGKEAQDTAIVRSVVAMAEELGLSVTAEGIETPAQWRQLRALGCAAGQGYFFCGPVPTAEMGRQLAEAHARALLPPAA